MATCPNGHESASDDFCDVCGYKIGAAALTQSGPEHGGGTSQSGPVPDGSARDGSARDGGSVPGDSCPRCGAARTGQFCEACGYDYIKGATGTLDPAGLPNSVMPPPSVTAPPPATPVPAPPAPPPPSPAGAAWTAVVTADQAYYDTVRAAGGPDAAEISFPAYCPERRFRLSGTEIRIGRRSVSRGIDPEIDLTGPPTDPGVSRMHAVLIASPDGSWSVVDPGSENGTLVNGSEVRPGQTVPLHDGDRIHLGAWTALTITRDATALPLTRAGRDKRLPATPVTRGCPRHQAEEWQLRTPRT
jgi:hypothetical protein